LVENGAGKTCGKKTLGLGYKPIRHVVCAGALGRIKTDKKSLMQLKLHKPTMMSIRPIQVEVTLYLGQHR